MFVFLFLPIPPALCIPPTAGTPDIIILVIIIFRGILVQAMESWKGILVWQLDLTWSSVELGTLETASIRFLTILAVFAFGKVAKRGLSSVRSCLSDSASFCLTLRLHSFCKASSLTFTDSVSLGWLPITMSLYVLSTTDSEASSSAFSNLLLSSDILPRVYFIDRAMRDIPSCSSDYQSLSSCSGFWVSKP